MSDIPDWVRETGAAGPAAPSGETVPDWAKVPTVSAAPQYSGWLRQPLLFGQNLAMGALNTLGALGNLLPRPPGAEALAADPSIYSYGGVPYLPTSQDLLSAVHLPQASLLPQNAPERYSAAAARGLGGAAPIALAAPFAAVPNLIAGGASGLGTQAGLDLGLPSYAAEGLGTVAGIGAGGGAGWLQSGLTSQAQQFATAGIPMRSIAYTGSGPLARFTGPVAPQAATEQDLGGMVESVAAAHGDARNYRQAGEVLQKDARDWINTELPARETAAWAPVDAKIPPLTPVNQFNFEQRVHDLAGKGGLNADLVEKTMPGLVKQFNSALQNKVPGSPVDWQDARALRTALGDMMGRPTVANAVGPDVLNSLYQSISSDLERTANVMGAGPEFATANATSNELRNFRDQVLGKKITSSDTGNREMIDPENAAKNLLSGARKGDTTLEKLRQELPSATDQLAAVHLRQTGLAEPENAASTVSPKFAGSIGNLDAVGSSSSLIPNPNLLARLRAGADIQQRLQMPEVGIPSGYAAAGLGSLAALGYAHLMPGSHSEDFIAHLLEGEAGFGGSAAALPAGLRYARNRMANSESLAKYGSRSWPAKSVGLSGFLGAIPPVQPNQ